MNALTTFNPLLATFVANQISPHTQRAYRSDLHHFFRNISTITTLSIVEYRDALARTHSIATVNRRLAVVKAFFGYLQSSGAIQVNPAVAVKLFPAPENATTEALSDVEVCSILSHIDSSSQKGAMHSALLGTMLHLGLRSAEVRALQPKDIGDDGGVATLSVWGKGMRRRVVPLPASVLDGIRAYERIARLKYTREALFTSTTNSLGKALSHEGLRKIIQTYCKLAGITKRVSPHSLRATCISNALENGATMVSVQYLAGWKSPAMIQRYDKRSQILKNSAAYAVNYRGVK